MNDEQTANWRLGMRILTSYLETDDTARQQLTAKQISDEYQERGIDGVIGAAMGLQAVAALLLSLLSATTGKPQTEIVQALGKGGESLLGGT